MVLQSCIIAVSYTHLDVYKRQAVKMQVILSENVQLLMSDEAHFHLDGNVNKRNLHYWAPDHGHDHVLFTSILYTLNESQCGVLLALLELLNRIFVRKMASQSLSIRLVTLTCFKRSSARTAKT